MDESEFRANPPRPGDKVWLMPHEFVETGPTYVLVKDRRGTTYCWPNGNIDHIERAPRALKVGDRVRARWGQIPATILAIDEDMAWCRNVGDDDRWTIRLADLEPVE